MTIPEAVLLVLQAATLATSGEVYMLDMGDPVRIMGLARKLIETAGLRPGQDIEIKVTGIRQGEKLHEQLWLEDANVEPTKFDRVHRVLSAERCPDITKEIAELERIASEGDEAEAFSALVSLPIEFKYESQPAVALADA
jgi:FlaA1/EpsC-like NDP-sugar epimerase